MIFFRSIVGKLWITILILVTFVVFILTMLFLEHIDSENFRKSEADLLEKIENIKVMIDKYKQNEILVDSIESLLPTNIGIFIADKEGEVFYQKNIQEIQTFAFSKLQSEEIFQKAMQQNDHTVMRWFHSVEKQQKSEDEQLLIAVQKFNGLEENQQQYIILYEPVSNILGLGKDTVKFLLVTAGLVLFLTTVFAFFLFSRITAPLRIMRSAVFEIARGKFDTKVPILTHDEIGELAISFNQMARQLKFTMNALRQEKEQLSSILSSMADGVFTIARDGEIIPLNVNAEKFFHLWYSSCEERQEKYDFMPEPLYQLFSNVVKMEHESMIEVAFKDYHWCIAMTPLYSHMHVRGTVAIVRDTTMERKLEKLRKDFIANVSHELRTPIAMIQGYSEAIVDDIAATEEEKKEIAQIIYEESQRMSRLVNELLDVARMEAGFMKLNCDRIEIRPYFERVLRRFDGIAADKKVSLHLSFETEKTNFMFDGDRIEQVITNLVDNAIRHTPEKGSVFLLIAEKDTELYVSVEDTGQGIPEEDIPFVFERFYKSDKARTRGKSGTGLGLSIVKNIIEAHKGKISVLSKQGQGTKFFFIIPQNEWLNDYP